VGVKMGSQEICHGFFCCTGVVMRTVVLGNFHGGVVKWEECLCVLAGKIELEFFYRSLGSFSNF